MVHFFTVVIHTKLTACFNDVTTGITFPSEITVRKVVVAIAAVFLLPLLCDQDFSAEAQATYVAFEFSYTISHLLHLLFDLVHSSSQFGML